MFLFFLRCKNDYLFKMRKTPAGGLLENDVKGWRNMAVGMFFSLISLMVW